MRVGKGFVVGLNTWYLAANGAARGVLKVRHGIVEEIGLADRGLTRTPRASRRFLTSFYYHGITLPASAAAAGRGHGAPRFP